MLFSKISFTAVKLVLHSVKQYYTINYISIVILVSTTVVKPILHGKTSFTIIKPVLHSYLQYQVIFQFQRKILHLPVKSVFWQKPPLSTDILVPLCKTIVLHFVKLILRGKTSFTIITPVLHSNLPYQVIFQFQRKILNLPVKSVFGQKPPLSTDI